MVGNGIPEVSTEGLLSHRQLFAALYLCLNLPGRPGAFRRLSKIYFTARAKVRIKSMAFTFYVKSGLPGLHPEGKSFFQ